MAKSPTVISGLVGLARSMDGSSSRNGSSSATRRSSTNRASTRPVNGFVTDPTWNSESGFAAPMAKMRRWPRWTIPTAIPPPAPGASAPVWRTRARSFSSTDSMPAASTGGIAGSGVSVGIVSGRATVFRSSGQPDADDDMQGRDGQHDRGDDGRELRPQNGRRADWERRQHQARRAGRGTSIPTRASQRRRRSASSSR